MRELIFDIETNGFLDELTKVHCIALADADGVRSFNGDAIETALAELEQADVLVGHNIMDFDLPALQKVYPDFNPKGLVRDTLVISRLIWPEIAEQDYVICRKNHSFPAKLIGSHKLEAWGYRLGEKKAEFGKVVEDGEGTSVWDSWSQEMEDYCRQDVVVTTKLWSLMKSKQYSEEAIQLEHDFRRIITTQEREGFPFDMQAAEKFYSELLVKRVELDKQIMPYFPNWETSKVFVPKVNNKKLGYVKHQPFTKVEVHTFNPNSDKQIIDRLKVQRKWQPVDFTEKGSPKIDGETLRLLGKEWPECTLLADRADIEKIIGMLAEGKNAWIKLAKKGADGIYRIHGKVITNGAVTGRCAHYQPNLGQIPKEGEMGERCRTLFITLPGYNLLGWDASGLELRMLAHFMGAYDDGAYVKVVTEGDVHTVNQQAAGLETRPDAKEFIYAWLYGAGGHKIGLIPGVTDEETREFQQQTGEWNSAKSTLEKRSMSTADYHVALEVKGRRLKRQFLKGLPALGLLKDAVEEKARGNKFIKGIDKRVLPCRSPHSSLNTLLQSAGALTVKKATVLWHEKLRYFGFADKVRQVVHVHDEAQALVAEGYEKEVGELARQSIQEAGRHFRFRCPLDGEWKVGRNWKDTH